MSKRPIDPVDASSSSSSTSSTEKNEQASKAVKAVKAVKADQDQDQKDLMLDGQMPFVVSVGEQNNVDIPDGLHVTADYLTSNCGKVLTMRLTFGFGHPDAEVSDDVDLKRETYPSMCYTDIRVSLKDGKVVEGPVLECSGRFGAGALVYRSTDCKDGNLVHVASPEDFKNIKRVSDKSTILREASARAGYLSMRGSDATFERVMKAYDDLKKTLDDLESKYPVVPVIWNKKGVLTARIIYNELSDRPVIRVRCGSDQLTFDVPIAPIAIDKDEPVERVYKVKTALVVSP